MRIFRRAFDFSGKANRAEFLRAIIYTILFVLAGAWLDETYVAPARGFLPGEEGAGNPTALLFAAIAAIPLSSTAVRFMHKLGVSGWWAATAVYQLWRQRPGRSVCRGGTAIECFPAW